MIIRIMIKFIEIQLFEYELFEFVKTCTRKLRGKNLRQNKTTKGSVLARLLCIFYRKSSKINNLNTILYSRISIKAYNNTLRFKV